MLRMEIAGNDLPLQDENGHHKNLTEIALPKIANIVMRPNSHPLLFDYKEGSKDVSNHILKQNFVITDLGI